MAEVESIPRKFELPEITSTISLTSDSDVSNLLWTNSDLELLADNYELMSIKKRRLENLKKTRSSFVCTRMKFGTWTRTKPVQLPKLDKQNLDIQTRPLKHNFCLDLLKEGFPNAFVQFFNIATEFDFLKEKHKAMILEGGILPKNTVENPNENMNEKYENLSKYLSKAEEAERKSQWLDVYQAKKYLAYYFQEVGDKWLTHLFYVDCLAIARKIKSDGGKRLAEAHGFMGLYYEYLGNLEKAAEHFRIMYKMSDNQNWQNIHYKPLHAEASLYIANVYSQMADKKAEEGNTQEAFRLYLKSLKMTHTANHRPMTINVYMKLGQMYMNRNEFNESMTCYRRVEKVCKEIGEFKSVCAAYQAMAEVCTSSGFHQEAREFIKKFAYTAERHNLSDELIKASFLLGIVSSSKDQNFELAWKSFSKSFEVAQRLNNVALGDTVRVHCGIALANHIIDTYSTRIVSKKKMTIKSLVDWKLQSEPILILYKRD